MSFDIINTSSCLLEYHRIKVSNWSTDLLSKVVIRYQFLLSANLAEHVTDRPHWWSEERGKSSKHIVYVSLLSFARSSPSALGPDNYGCRMPCEDSAYGCCEDGATPAHGSNNEGCCLSSTYKCCPDNVMPARGPNFYGCACQYTRFGCCPDNSTAARGPNNEGCGCQYTLHGCCPNRFTPASGPSFEGCPCYTYQFGCCPDGVTIAKGARGQGNCASTVRRSLPSHSILKVSKRE